MSGLVEYRDRALVWKQEPAVLEDCAETAAAINYFNENIQWAFGDFFNHLSDLFGEASTQLWPDVEKSKKTVMKWLFTCRQIPADQRKYNVSFSHYAEVAGLDAQKRNEWLELAEREEWSVAKMRRMMHGEPDKKPKTVECPSCHVSFEV